MLTQVILTGLITSQSSHLAFHGGNLVSLITYKGTILYKAVSWYLKVLCIYILSKWNEKMKGNGVVAKLLFLISV